MRRVPSVRTVPPKSIQHFTNYIIDGLLRSLLLFILRSCKATDIAPADRDGSSRYLVFFVALDDREGRIPHILNDTDVRRIGIVWLCCLLSAVDCDIARLRPDGAILDPNSFLIKNLYVFFASTLGTNKVRHVGLNRSGGDGGIAPLVCILYPVATSERRWLL